LFEITKGTEGETVGSGTEGSGTEGSGTEGSGTEGVIIEGRGTGVAIGKIVVVIIAFFVSSFPLIELPEETDVIPL
jgi:hypothetical protein